MFMQVLAGLMGLEGLSSVQEAEPFGFFITKLQLQIQQVSPGELGIELAPVG